MKRGLRDVHRRQLVQAALRLDERIVASEHELVLQAALHLADHLRRDVLRGPARDVDVDVGLVQSHRQQLEVPGIAEVRGDHVQTGECGRHSVEPDGTRVVEPDALPAGLAGPDAARAGVKQQRQPQLLAPFVQRPEPLVVRPERLQ